MKKQIVVIGQGQFGVGVAVTATNMGHDVLAIDLNERKVQQVASQVTHAVQADATNEAVLRELGISKFDIAVIGIGDRMEPNVLATILTKKLGIPYVVSRAETEIHGDILEKVGADRIIYPEWETGVRVAHEITLVDADDYLPLTDSYGIIKLKATADLAGQKLSALGLGHQGRWEIAVFMIQRDEEIIMNPRVSETVREGDVLILSGSYDNLDKMLAEAKKNGAKD